VQVKSLAPDETIKMIFADYTAGAIRCSSGLSPGGRLAPAGAAGLGLRARREQPGGAYEGEQEGPGWRCPDRLSDTLCHRE
jgi:hypothetical protein